MRPEDKDTKPAVAAKKVKKMPSQLQAERAAAVEKLVELKQADPKDADAVLAQKKVVQDIDAQIAE